MKKTSFIIGLLLLALFLTGCGPTYEEGYQKGRSEGIEQGYADGYDAGYEKGETKGKEVGETIGVYEGEKNTDTYKLGYDDGYNAGMQAQFDLGRDEDLEAAYDYILENSDILYEDALDRFYDSYYDHFVEVFANEGRLKDDW